MKLKFGQIVLVLLLLAPFSLQAATVNFQLQVNAPDPSGGSSSATGGGGSSAPISNTPNTTLSGWTSPYSYVEMISGTQLLGTTIAAQDGSFGIKNVITSNITVYIKSTDTSGNISKTEQNILMTAGATTPVTGVILPSTLTFSSSSFNKGATILGSGRAVPGANVAITYTDSKGATGSQLISVAANGTYNVSIDSTNFAVGSLMVQVLLSFNNKSVSVSYPLTIISSAVADPETGCKSTREDFNCDNKVNLQDLSMMLAYFGKTNPPRQFDLNGDKKINLIDFSILLYYLNRPIKIAFAREDDIINNNDITPPTVVLDFGKMPNGKIVAAFSATDEQNDIKKVEISLDKGKNWRPAESPYEVGTSKVAGIMLRATDANGNETVVGSGAEKNYFVITFSVIAGIILAILFIILNLLITKKHA